MKKINLIFGILTLFTLTFTSCSESENEPIPDNPIPTPEKVELPDNPIPNPDKVELDEKLKQIHKIDFVSVQMHFHGDAGHGNPQNETPLRVKQHSVFEKNDEGKFISINGDENDKDYVQPNNPFVMLGKDVMNDNYSFKYGFEFILYDKEGNRLENGFYDSKESYQTLFSVSEYTKIETGEVVKVGKTKDFFDYTYRDTKDPVKMYHNVRNPIEPNFLGLKGYAFAHESKISYKINIRFAKLKDKLSKNNSIFLEDTNTEKIGSFIEFEIPIVIPVGRSDNKSFTIMAKYFNMSEEEYTIKFWKSKPRESSQYWM